MDNTTATTKTNAPRTYAAAVKVAEIITEDELAEMIAADNNPEIFPGPRQPRRIAMKTTMSEWGGVNYYYGNRNGYEEFGSVRLSRIFPPVFRFNNGHTVKVMAD